MGLIREGVALALDRETPEPRFAAEKM